MSTPNPRPYDPRYVAARRVLLDALHALSAHSDAIVIAGAQAVYLHTGATDLDLTIAPYTTDGDLAINPSLLGDDPVLEAVMEGAGFHLSPQPGGHIEPGIWLAPAGIDDSDLFVPVDLIVPEGAYSGGGTRAARLGPHGKRAARRAVGLEAALIDNATMTITALDPADDRAIDAHVAGPAALLVAKAHKINDRLASPRADRLVDKDAADVLRLMQATSPRDVGATLAQLRVHPTAGPATEAAIGYLAASFGRQGRPGIDMATRAMQLALTPEYIEALAVAYVTALISAALQADPSPR